MPSRPSSRILAALAAVLLITAPAQAQEGAPLLPPPVLAPEPLPPPPPPPALPPPPPIVTPAPAVLPPPQVLEVPAREGVPPEAGAPTTIVVTPPPVAPAPAPPKPMVIVRPKPVTDAPVAKPSDPAVAAESVPVAALKAPEPKREEPPASSSSSSSSWEMGWFGLGVRVGVNQPALVAGDVPIVGAKIRDVLDRANKGVTAYNEVAPAAGKAKASPYLITDMDLSKTLFEVTPTLHLGGDFFFTKLEVPIGVSDDLKTYGFGFYPLNLGLYLPGVHLFPYGSLGGVATWATSQQVTLSDGSVIPTDSSGVMLQGRVAVGAKLWILPGLALNGEVGYSPLAVGGVIRSGNPPTPAPGELPEHPAASVRGGVGSMINFAVGADWL